MTDNAKEKTTRRGWFSKAFPPILGGAAGAAAGLALANTNYNITGIQQEEISRQALHDTTEKLKANGLPLSEYEVRQVIETHALSLQQRTEEAGEENIRKRPPLITIGLTALGATAGATYVGGGIKAMRTGTKAERLAKERESIPLQEPERPAR